MWGNTQRFCHKRNAARKVKESKELMHSLRRSAPNTRSYKEHEQAEDNHHHEEEEHLHIGGPCSATLGDFVTVRSTGNRSSRKQAFGKELTTVNHTMYEALEDEWDPIVEDCQK